MAEGGFDPGTRPAAAGDSISELQESEVIYQRLPVTPSNISTTNVSNCQNVVTLANVSAGRDANINVANTQEGPSSTTSSICPPAVPTSEQLVSGSGAEVYTTKDANTHIGDVSAGRDAYVIIKNISNSKVQQIQTRTASRIKEWTPGMVVTLALTNVLQKLKNGSTWVTIKGQPGEGKTTVAYMALGKLHESGRQVFHVITPEEFSDVTDTCHRPVIMLDDVFGNLIFDHAKWSQWKQVLDQILNGKEHRSHERGNETAKEYEATVILVGRDYVLNSASSDMGRLSDYFTHDAHVVNMSITERGIQEKRAIWKVISEASGIELDENTTDTICDIHVPHGFPHVCRLFVTMRQEDANIEAERFFKAPLVFLNQTVQKFMTDDVKRTLFKEMIKRNGSISIRDLGQIENSEDVKEVANSLLGSYLIKEDGIFTFKHPSIYDSVAFILCKNDPLFVIENCHLSFLHERIRLEPPRHTQCVAHRSESDLVVNIPTQYLKDLAKRFAKEIVNSNLVHVLSHPAVTDQQFAKQMMSCIWLPRIRLPSFSDKTTGQNLLSLIASSKSPQLLKYLENQRLGKFSKSKINTVLHGVCKYGALDVLTYLLQTRGVIDINVRYENERTPLMIASGSRDSQFVMKMISLGPDLNARDQWGATILHYLCDDGLVIAAEEVIIRGTAVDVENIFQESPLLSACSSNHVEVVRLLLDRGVRFNAGAVVTACLSGSLDVVKFLFKRGATVNMATYSDTPLTAACEGGHVQVMMFLIEIGASANKADDLGRPPLHRACSCDRPEAVKCLIDHGADINSRDTYCEPPLDTVAEWGPKECYDVFMNAGAGLTGRNTYGNAPLNRAAEVGSEECVYVLLNAGADLNVQNSDDNTPLHIAAETGSTVCIGMLLKFGADVTVQNKGGYTPLDIAEKWGHEECFNVLLTGLK